MSLPVLAGKFRAFSQAGVPLNGGKLFSYIAGTVTPQSTYTDNGLLTPNANPVILDANGEAQVWVSASVAYKFILQDSLGNVQWTTDNYTLGGGTGTGGGGGGGGTTGSEWISYTATATFVSATSFTVVGDQRATFAVGTRVKSTNTAGTVYSTVSVVAFGAVTTVTLSNDSPGVLDSGLSAVSTGLLAVSNPSSPSGSNSAVLVTWSSATAVVTATPVILGSTTMAPAAAFDVLSEFSLTTGIFTPKRAGYYRCSVTWQPTAAGVTYSGACTVQALKNGSAIGNAPNFDLLSYVTGATGGGPQAAGSLTVQLAALDTLKLQATLTFSAGTNTCGVGQISIEKVG